MCYTAANAFGAPPSLTQAGKGRFGPPSIRSTFSPGYGLQDMKNVIEGKPRDNGNLLLDALTPKVPQAPQLPPPPQAPKSPDTSPLKRRNSNGGLALTGSTLLSGPSGITSAQLNLGSQTLLGGG